MNTETTTLGSKEAWEAGRDHAADMFGLIRHINESGNGAGLAVSAEVRSVDCGYDYPDGQINVCEHFIRELLKSPEHIEGFGAVLTHLLAVVEMGDPSPNMHLIAQVSYEMWRWEGPADPVPSETTPVSPLGGPATEAAAA